jgi:hypothetical protein
MLLTSISYEGTYGLILPLLVKIGLTAILGIIIVRLAYGVVSTIKPDFQPGRAA